MSVRILNMDINRTKCATLETKNGAKICRQNTFCGMRDIQIKQQQVRFSGSSTRRPWRLSRCLSIASESTSQSTCLFYIHDVI